AKNTAASVAVVRVNTLALPRLVKNPPVPPPMPSPPPSERCSRTTPVMARTTMRWITMMTVCIFQNHDQRQRAAGLAPDFSSPAYRKPGLSTRSPAAFPLSTEPRCSRVGGGDAEKILGLETGPAHEGAIDTRDGEQFGGVVRLHRSPVEHPHRFAGR